jgi:hypothetical protein
MKVITLIISALSISIFFLISPFSAVGDVSRSNYIVYKHGIYSAESDNLKDSDTKYYGELLFGRYLSPYLSMQTGISYLDTEGTLRESDQVLGSIVGNADVTAIGILATARGYYPFKLFPIKKGELFAGAGAGLYFVDGEADLTTSVGDFSVDDEDTIYGVHFELGSNIDITRVVFFGIEGKYLWAEEAKLKGNAFGTGVEFEYDLTRIIITVDIGFRF